MTTATMTPNTLDNLDALAGTEPTTRRLAYEVHPDGGVFIPQQVALEVPRPLFESLALNIHRAALEASPAEEESDYYEQYTLAPNKALENIKFDLSYDRDTNTATAAYTVHKPMYLTGEALSWYLKTVYLLIDGMGQLEDLNRPVNAAAHLLEAADRIEKYAAETDSENFLDVAAHLFAQYLVIFSAREYESDYTPIEHLEDALLSEDDYTALRSAGLICPMVDDSDEPSAYFLTLFAGEE